MKSNHLFIIIHLRPNLKACKRKKSLKFIFTKDRYQFHFWLIAHPQVWNTFRDPQEAPVHWKKELSWETIKAIQKKCKTAMKLWGYRIIESKNDGITMIKKSL